jgi:hypothetical protein
MASYSESLMPPPLDNRPVVEVPTQAAAGSVCDLCRLANCPLPGACQ